MKLQDGKDKRPHERIVGFAFAGQNVDESFDLSNRDFNQFTPTGIARATR